MKKTLITGFVALALITGAIYASASRNNSRTPAKSLKQKQQQQQQQQTSKKRPRIDLVIALDTSGSMGGLINAARQKLWDIVNQASRTQPSPILRVALVTYGSDGTEADGYVKIRSKLTTDLDSLYSKLFELRTSGGTEYVGRAVHRSLRELNWSKDPDALKQIFVAGNESADQDRTVTARAAVAAARKAGVFVNALFCGDSSMGVRMGWAKVAKLGGGAYASIDHNSGTVNINTPYDRRLGMLNRHLNGTYVGYGRFGRAGMANQRAQDKNAARSAGAAGAARTIAKASSVYNNARWDLVDAKKAGKLAKLNKDALPGHLRKLSKAELSAYVAKLAAKRAKIRKEILELSKKRAAHIRSEMKRRGIGGKSAFDSAVRRTMRKQARKKGIKMH